MEAVLKGIYSPNIPDVEGYNPDTDHDFGFV